VRILAGDIGGTKTALALYERTTSGDRLLSEGTFASADHAGLVELLRQFVAPGMLPLDAAAFGVAGPVQGGVCRTTNLPWVVAEQELERSLGAPVCVVNDLHATAVGVRELAADGLCVLQASQRDPDGPVALIGAGTGLGESIGVVTSGGFHVVSGEGGHADYAPRSDAELRLLTFLLQRYPHVSWERVASGMALGDLYDFVIADGQAQPDAETTRRFATEAPAIPIVERADQDHAAELAVQLLLAALAAEAGNLALRCLPTGGLYVVGGIARRLLPRMQDGRFIAGFLAKGRMSKILETIPVAVATDPRVGLLGARTLGALLSGRPSQ
jgi:glucokinase